MLYSLGADNNNIVAFYDIIHGFIGTNMLYLIKLLIKTDENLNAHHIANNRNIRGRLQSLKITMHPEQRLILNNPTCVEFKNRIHSAYSLFIVLMTTTYFSSLIKGHTRSVETCG